LTAHGVSAANNLYWPEIYTNFSIADPNNKNPYFDTPSPRVFGNVSPMDPQLFTGINEFADELLKGKRSGKYSPIEYAQWVEDFADETTKHLELAKTESKATRKPEFRRMAIDAVIASGLGRFSVPNSGRAFYSESSRRAVTGRHWNCRFNIITRQGISG